MDNHSTGTVIPLQPLRSYHSSGNTSQASAAASEERRNQITTDLANGVYECAVCSDTIRLYAGIWSCQDCHNLFHHACISKWAACSGRFAWPCPACKSLQVDPGSRAKCWCGKAEKSSFTLPNVIQGNSCDRVCEKLRSCPERSCDQMCEKICHPGSCDEVKCTVGCKNFAVEAREVRGMDKMPVVVGVLPREPRPYRVAGVDVADAAVAARDFDGQAPDPNPQVRVRRVENPNWYQRLAQRWREDVPSKNVVGFILFLLFIGFFNGLGAIWAVKKAERVTQPLQHQYYTENAVAHNGEFWVSLVVGIPLIMFPAGLSGIVFMFEATTVCMKAFGLPSRSGKLFLIRALLFAFAGASFACYLLLQCYLPVGVWNKQFAHGCDGFDAMVSLDKAIGEGSKTGYIQTLTDTIQLYDPRLGDESFDPPGTNAFNFSTPVDISKRPTDNFYSFHRMTGITTTLSLAYDFDLHHRVWRMLDLSSPITQQGQTLESSAILTDTTSNLLQNGTWSQPTKANPHLTLPELNLLIPAFRLFQRNCYYQPFMKVYNISGMSQHQIEDVSWRQWSGENEEGVVMRTRTYRENGPLSVCFRKGDFNAGSARSATDVKKGLGDEGLVPAGLIAVMRLQLTKDGKAGGCGRK